MPESEMAAEERPYLSLVVTTRNDDHGGGLLARTQAFVSGWIEQARRFGISSELIIVEWNPPTDRPRLVEVLRWPEDFGPCQVRFLEVPAELHQRYVHSDALPLYQMIAKNVGIRRARGRFVLATNIDILFSSELATFFAGRTLQPNRMYRIDRHDAMSGIPEGRPVEEQLEYCRSHLIRVNRREGSFPVQRDGAPAVCSNDIVSPGAGVVPGRGWFPVEYWDPQEPFRWAGERAELCISAAGDGVVALKLHVMPGLQLEDDPIRLEAADAEGRVLGSVLLNTRGWWHIPFNGALPEKIVLRARGTPAFTGVDPRPLMFRVFRIEWEDGKQSEEKIHGSASPRERENSPQPIDDCAPVAAEAVAREPAAADSPSDSDAAVPTTEHAPSEPPELARPEWVPDEPPTTQIEPLSKAKRARSAWRALQHLIERLADGGPRATVDIPLTPGWRRILKTYVMSGGITGMLRHGIVRPGAQEPAVRSAVAPDATVPEAAAREVTTPNTPVPEATAPETYAPETSVPEGAAPEATAPEVAPERTAKSSPAPSDSMPPAFLHTNGCGDFTLLAREHWLDLRAYPEFDVFSMNLDSVFCFMAHHGGAREEVLAEPMRIFHIEHGSGSGWTPEGQQKLFERIWAKGLSFIDNEEVLRWAAQMRRLEAPMIFNRDNWGLAEFELKETVLPAPASPEKARTVTT